MWIVWWWERVGGLDAVPETGGDDPVSGVHLSSVRRGGMVASEEENTEKEPSVAVASREEKKRLEYRYERFLDMGYQPEIAELLAAEKVDWHEAQDMIDKGASLNHVLRILL